jgi:thiol:disulfide interchange protein DsbG
MKKLVSLILSLCCFSLTAQAYAADASAAQSLIQKVVSGHDLTIQKTFAGPGDLQGFVLKAPQGTPIIMYANKDGKFVFYGNLWGADGVDITKANNEKYVQSEITKTVFDHLDKVTTFTQGDEKAAYSMYVVADPNCSACHAFYKEAEPAIKAGKLKVQWVLVAFLNPTSMGRAATILSAKDPVQAFLSNENKFSNATEEGGVKPLNTIPDAIQKKLDGNMSFFKNSGLQATPTLIFWDKDGKQTFVTGVPRDLDGFLTHVGPVIKQ